ncbi:hypothetical protein A5N82_05480 [Christensenella minuta]|nr:hypothetical protein B1H56_12470 [Christensenella minuta]OAQ40135.1 hypothetical protein A5N82_05480 [Christensenella minuta]
MYIIYYSSRKFSAFTKILTAGKRTSPGPLSRGRRRAPYPSRQKRDQIQLFIGTATQRSLVLVLKMPLSHIIMIFVYDILDRTGLRHCILSFNF